MAAYRSLGYEIAKVHKALKAQLQELLSPYDVTVQQFEILRILKQNAGITAAQLVTHMISDSSTIMSILKRLEAKELIIRRTDGNDRRVKLIYLTEDGQRLIGKLIGLADRFNQRVLDCCSVKELQIVVNVLAKLYSSFQSNRDYYHAKE